MGVKLLRQCVSNHCVRGRIPQESAAGGRDHDVLAAVLSHVSRWYGMRRRFDFIRPQLLAVARIKGAEPAVDRGTDEYEVPRRRNSAAEIWCARLQPFRSQFVEHSKRRAP